jgi:hypothetical protein
LRGLRVDVTTARGTGIDDPHPLERNASGARMKGLAVETGERIRTAPKSLRDQAAFFRFNPSS